MNKILCLLIVGWQLPIFAERVKQAQHIVLSNNSPANLIIDPTAFLNSKQKKLLYSGFPAHGVVTLFIRSNDDTITVVSERRCSIQYDLWDENFTYFSLEKSLKLSERDYQNRCLIIRLADNSQSKTLVDGSRGKLMVRVSYTQISGQTNNDITSWLVQQQSSVIKGLFSHMLGELKLAESQEFEVVQPDEPRT